MYTFKCFRTLISYILLQKFNSHINSNQSNANSKNTCKVQKKMFDLVRILIESVKLLFKKVINFKVGPLITADLPFAYF